MNFENIFPFRNVHSIYDINILMDFLAIFKAY